MKKLSILGVVLCAILYSCVTYTSNCGMLKDKLMFVPQSTEQTREGFAIYNSKGDSAICLGARMEPVKVHSFTSDHQGHGCGDSFLLDYSFRRDVFIFWHIKYKFQHEYDGYRETDWSAPIYVNVSVGRSSYTFSYTVNRDSTLHTVSAPVLDSLTVNKVSYRDVVELKDSVQTIHVAKDYGIVQIIENDSTVWTLNKWES